MHPVDGAPMCGGGTDRSRELILRLRSSAAVLSSPSNVFCSSRKGKSFSWSSSLIESLRAVSLRTGERGVGVLTPVKRGGCRGGNASMFHTSRTRPSPSASAAWTSRTRRSSSAEAPATHTHTHVQYIHTRSTHMYSIHTHAPMPWECMHSSAAAPSPPWRRSTCTRTATSGR